MSNKKKQVIVQVCDNCGKDKDVFYHCDRCKKDFCYDCFKKVGVKYAFSTNFSGSEDGEFCKECDRLLRNDKNDKYSALHTAYLHIQDLRDKAKEFYKQFEQDGQDAENNVKHQRNLLNL